MVYMRCKIVSWKSVLALLVLLIFTGISSAQNVSSSSVTSNSAVLTDITTKIYCPCGGCNYVLAYCQCDTAVSITKDIKRRLESGESPEKIIMGFVDLYGPSILVEALNSEGSTAKGGSKNLDMLPFYLLGIGGTAVVAYKLGQSKSKNDVNWEIENKKGKKGRKKRRKYDRRG
jgi:cytochrome c-type biogenesis protein CcmH/NrfF